MIRAGGFLRIKYGEYSDRGTLGIFVVAETFDPRAEARAHIDSLEEWQRDGYATVDFEAFIERLVEKRILVRLPHLCWHLGDYGIFKMDDWP